VLHQLAATGALDGGLKIRCVHLPDRFIDHGTPAEMYADAGMTAQDLAATARRALGLGEKVVPLLRDAG
jgi:1-deoxy-D-xylulose-5-phosphate synthase